MTFETIYAYEEFDLISNIQQAISGFPNLKEIHIPECLIYVTKITKTNDKIQR